MKQKVISSLCYLLILILAINISGCKSGVTRINHENILNEEQKNILQKVDQNDLLMLLHCGFLYSSPTFVETELEHVFITTRMEAIELYMKEVMILGDLAEVMNTEIKQIGQEIIGILASTKTTDEHFLRLINEFAEGVFAYEMALSIKEEALKQFKAKRNQSERFSLIVDEYLMETVIVYTQLLDEYLYFLIIGSELITRFPEEVNTERMDNFTTKRNQLIPIISKSLSDKMIQSGYVSFIYTFIDSADFYFLEYNNEKISNAIQIIKKFSPDNGAMLERLNNVRINSNQIPEVLQKPPLKEISMKGPSLFAVYADDTSKDQKTVLLMSSIETIRFLIGEHHSNGDKLYDSQINEGIINEVILNMILNSNNSLLVDVKIELGSTIEETIKESKAGENASSKFNFLIEKSNDLVIDKASLLLGNVLKDKQKKNTLIKHIEEKQFLLNMLSFASEETTYNSLIGVLSELLSKNEGQFDEVEAQKIEALIRIEISDILGNSKSEFLQTIINTKAEILVERLYGWLNGNHYLQQLTLDRTSFISLLEVLGVKLDSEVIEELERTEKVNDASIDRVSNSALVKSDENTVVMTYPAFWAMNKNFISTVEKSMGSVPYETFINETGTISFVFDRKEQEVLIERNRKELDEIGDTIKSLTSYAFIQDIYFDENYTEMVMAISEEDEKEKAGAASLMMLGGYLRSIIYQGISGIEAEDMIFKASISSPSTGVIRASKKYSVMEQNQ